MQLQSIPSLGPTYNPCILSRGKWPNKLMVIGEAPGETEERKGLPFVGASGDELARMLAEAGLDIDSLFLTNVFQTRPFNNKLERFFVDSQWRKENISQMRSLPPYKIETRSLHLHPALYPELDRLETEIQRCNPNLILALGNTALWALTGRQNIGSVRGTVQARADGRKLLPTYHPAAVLRNWSYRAIVVADLVKAKGQAEFPEIRRPSRLIHINPTIMDIRAWCGEILPNARALAVDVETRKGQITEIGFAVSPHEALVVPFVKGFKENYWPTEAEEVEATQIVRNILDSPLPKIFQNGLYDIQYIWKNFGIPPRNCVEDTMLRHHALFPELQKGLGFMGSLYTDEPAWKLMRLRGMTEEKSDDE